MELYGKPLSFVPHSVNRFGFLLKDPQILPKPNTPKGINKEGRKRKGRVIWGVFLIDILNEPDFEGGR